MGVKRKRENDENTPPLNVNISDGNYSHRKQEEINFYTAENIVRMFQAANIAHLLPQFESCHTRDQIKMKLVMMDIKADVGSSIRTIIVNIHYEETMEKIRRQLEAKEISQAESDEALLKAQALYFRDGSRYVLSS